MPKNGHKIAKIKKNKITFTLTNFKVPFNQSKSALIFLFALTPDPGLSRVKKKLKKLCKSYRQERVKVKNRTQRL